MQLSNLDRAFAQFDLDADALDRLLTDIEAAPPVLTGDAVNQYAATQIALTKKFCATYPTCDDAPLAAAPVSLPRGWPTWAKVTLAVIVYAAVCAAAWCWGWLT